MDFSKFKTPDWLMIGGGAGMLIFGFALDWTIVGHRVRHRRRW